MKAVALIYQFMKPQKSMTAQENEFLLFWASTLILSLNFYSYCLLHQACLSSVYAHYLYSLTLSSISISTLTLSSISTFTRSSISTLTLYPMSSVPDSEPWPSS